MNTRQVLHITPDSAGQRLDKTLARLVPGLSLRAARRLCAGGQVMVNGVPRTEACTLHAGDTVVCAPPEPDERDTASYGVRLIRTDGHLAALFKPAGLHSQALAGGYGPSIETALSTLLPAAEHAPGYPRLLNRLDCPTSGLILSALDERGLRAWRDFPGEKRYLALLWGRLTWEITIPFRLELRNPRHSRATAQADPDAARHTRLRPLASASCKDILPLLGLEQGAQEAEISLAACSIVRGARHQIRAHCAAIRLPLLADTRYGSPSFARIPPPKKTVCRGDFFFLHHGRFLLPGFAAACAPDWLDSLPPDWRAAGLDWLHMTP